MDRLDFSETDPLAEWNRLNIENTENALVSIIYEGVIESTKLIDNYSTWLTAGTGAVIALFIANIGGILPYLSERGFKVSGVLLALSILSGVLSKAFAIVCFVSVQHGQNNSSKIKDVLTPYYEAVEKINEYAVNQDRKLVSDIDMARVIRKFSEPLPWWFKRFLVPRILKGADNPHAGYLMPLRFYRWQCAAAFIQVVLLISSFIMAFIYAKNI